MPGWEQTENEIRHRIRNPELFVEDSFRATDFGGKLPEGVYVIRGKLKENNEWASQSIRFKKDKWTLEEAKRWWEEHKDDIKTRKDSQVRKAGFPVEFKSVDEANRTIEGYASTDDVDLDGERVLPEAFRKVLPQFMRNPVLMSLHMFERRLPIGKILQAEIRKKGLWVKGWISKTAPEIWTLIKEGILRAFSIGFDYDNEKDVEMDGDVRVIKNIRTLFEISIVPIPANPYALFEQAKAKGIELKTLTLCKEGESVNDKKGEWTVEYVNSMEDDCFAVVEPTGKKDDEGRTVPRTARHLPHHAKGQGGSGTGGTVDLPHLRNALARMNQITPVTDKISAEELRAKAKKHLVAHAKKEGIGDWEDEKEEKKMEVKLQQDLQDALKFIKDVKEKVENIPTRSEFEEFKEKVEDDVLKVVNDQQKKRRKFEFETELDKDPYVNMSALAHPRIFLAKTPRQKFANLLSITTRDPRVKEMQVAADDLLLTHVLMKKFNPGYSGIRSLKMFERYMQVSSEFRKALDTATAGEGAEWIPTQFSADLIDKMRLELQVASLFGHFTMPTSPFKYPLLTGDVTVYYVPESLTDLSEKIPASDVTTAGLTFTAKKLAARVLCSEEVSEDAVVAVLPVLKEDLAKAMAGAIDNVIINGDDSPDHQDSDVTDNKDARKAWKGLRKLTNSGPSGAKYDASTFNASALRQIRKLMGKYGVNPRDLAYVVSISAYIQMLGFSEVATVDKFGEQATWLKGFLTALDGAPVVVSEYVRQDLNELGVYDSVTTDRTIVMAVNKACFLVGDRRNPTVKTKEEIETDQQILVISQRLDFEKKYAAAENCVGLGYNISS